MMEQFLSITSVKCKKSMSLSKVDSARKYLSLFMSNTVRGSPKLDICFMYRIFGLSSLLG